jgi:hypothetical protein
MTIIKYNQFYLREKTGDLLFRDATGTLWFMRKAGGWTKPILDEPYREQPTPPPAIAA